MELNDIRIFMALYNNKSISITADKLNYTQSNISTRLMKLEKEFDTKFFIRSKSGLEVLPAAERFMKYATQIDMLSNNLYHEFNTKKYTVNIASTQLLSRLYFPLLYQNNNTFQLYTSSLKKLARGLENKIYDIIITHTKIDFDGEVLCYSKSEQLCWAQDKRIKSLAQPDLSLIVSRDKGCPLRNASFQFLASTDQAMPVIEVDTLDLMLSLLHSVNCIALLPQKIIDTESNLVKSTEFNPTSLTVYFYCNHEDKLRLIKNLI